MHGLERGERAAAAAAAAALASNRRDLDALVHELNGLIALRSGRLDEALSQFDAAVALLADLDPDDRPTVLLNRGAVHLLRRDLRAARADLSASARLAAELGLTRQEFKAHHNLGYAEFLAGDIPAALRAFALADALDTDVSRSVWFLDRARVLMEAGLLEEADQALASASELLRRERANQDRAETELARAEVALLQGDWTVAKAHSTRARRDFRRRQSIGWQARADVTRWQAYLDTKGGPARVAREIRSAVAASDEATMDRQLALIAAEANLALGHVEEAGSLLEQVSRAGSGDPLSGRLHHHLVRAGVARAAGDITAARRELKTGLTTLANQQARHHSLDLRTAMAVHGGRLAELDLRIALESGSARSVFTSLERWRAMSHRRTAVRPPRDEELADLLAGLRITTEEIRHSPPGRPVEHLRRRQRAFERAVREREWTLHGGGRAERYATLADIQPLLDQQDTAVVAYFVLDHRLGAVTVGRGRPRVVTLGAWSEASALMSRVRADLDALAGRMLPPPLRQAVSASLAHDLDKLDRLLLPSSLTEAGALLVIPSRTLATAPWSLLPRRVGRPTTVALSATGWLRGQTAPIHSPRVSALAGPGLALSRPRGRGRRRDLARRRRGRQRARQRRLPRHGPGDQRPRPHRRPRAAQPGQPAVLQHPDVRRSAVRVRHSFGRAGRRAHRPVRLRPRAHDAACRRGGPRPDRGAAQHRRHERGQLRVAGRRHDRLRDDAAVPPAAGRWARLPDRAGRGPRRRRGHAGGLRLLRLALECRAVGPGRIRTQMLPRFPPSAHPDSDVAPELDV